MKKNSKGPVQSPTIHNETIKTIYEDEFLIIVDKPSGLPSQQTPDPKRPHLYKLLGEQLKTKDHDYLALHHRLDVGTSGLILLSKSKNHNKSIAELFTERKIQKTYVFIGRFQSKKAENESLLCTEDRWKVDNHLKKLSKPKSHMQIVRSGGDRAITEFEKLNEQDGFLQVLAKPLTGRMHQIRVHALASGCPILGDRLYNKAKPHFDRLLLHAESLKFKHPVSKKEMEVTSERPWDFQKVLKSL